MILMFNVDLSNDVKNVFKKYEKYNATKNDQISTFENPNVKKFNLFFDFQNYIRDWLKC